MGTLWDCAGQVATADPARVSFRLAELVRLGGHFCSVTSCDDWGRV